MGFCQALMSSLFEYDTQKIVHIQSKTIGIINRLLQLLIISYVVGFVIVYKKGYQEFDDVVGSVSTKVKGYSIANRTLAGNYVGIWDVADYTVPPQENGAIFVTTNAILTYGQEQKTCPEAASVKDFCNSDKDCEPNSMKTGGNGVRTGKCVNSTETTESVCEIHSWCPLENDTLTGEPLLTSAVNFTLFVKNNILFPKFGVARKNVPPSLDCQYDVKDNPMCPIFRLGTLKDVVRSNFTEMALKTILILVVNYTTFRPLHSTAFIRSNILDSDLKRCRFNATDPSSKFCPIFKLDDIVQFTNFQFDELNLRGASIQISITWECNLDHEVSACLPEYGFKRLDTNATSKSSEGYNFRYAHYYREDNATRRILVKAYGIQFIIVVQGQAGKFNIVPLMLNIGSGLALLSLASIMCDIVMLYILKSRFFYRDKKYQNVEEDYQENELIESSVKIDKNQLIKNQEETATRSYGSTT